jgi:peptide/nickel transport system substrate-binding protein
MGVRVSPARSNTRRRGLYSAIALTAAALVVAACSSSSTSTPSSTSTSSSPSSASTVKTGGQAVFALDEDIAGFNPDQYEDNEFVLYEIQNATLPSAYVIQPNFTVKLNTNVVTSATETNTSPMTIVYQINPKAVWSDGVPISAADFIYNWQAQSGSPKYKDIGNAAFLPAGTAGYSQIKSVTSSNNGKTATVVFSSPFPDWQSLFAPIIPAHIADKVGFNNGFQSFNAAAQVSGGPYMIQSYNKNVSLVEVRNPKYWGTPGNLNKIIFDFILDDSQAPPAMANGEVNMVNPALGSSTLLDSLNAIPGVTTSVNAGLEFQHMDFNESNPYLAVVGIRHAIAYGTNREQMIQRLVDPLTTKIGLLGNRIYMPPQPEYQDTSAGYGAFNPSMAESALKAAGMTMGSDGYFHPNFGPEKGQDFTLSISTTSGVEERLELEELFQADMKSIGVKINIQNYPAATLFGTIGPKSEFQIIEFAWVQSPFPSASYSIYCSYTNAELCGDNWDHYSDKQVDADLNQAMAATSPTQESSLFNQADALMWKDMATLPLFEEPTLYGWSSSYGNVIPNASSQGLTWNASLWGTKV